MKIVFNLLLTIGRLFLGFINLVSAVVFVVAMYLLYIIVCVLYLFRGGCVSRTFWEILLDHFEGMRLDKNK